MAPHFTSSANDISSSSSSAQSRLANISAHMSPSTQSSVFTQDVVPQAPEDPLFGLMAAFRRDTSPNKVDLGVGAYRDDNAKPWVLPVVKMAEEKLRKDPQLNHEYLPIAGLADFTSAAAKLILGGDSPAIKENRVASFQTISGTGAVHLGALFLAKFYPRTANQPVYFSAPTWVNHHQIFGNVGLPVQTYPYFSSSTKGLDFTGMIKGIEAAPEGSIILLHACAHNPTGVDPTAEQWKEIAAVIRSKNHFPFFDCAYQGFASGDLKRDAWAVQYFIEQGFELVVAQSFAKNFGLYGERTGCFHYVAAPSGAEASSTATRVASQLAILQRSEISNPPAYGARIASAVLNDPALFAEWEGNLRTMSGRIITMRKALRQNLENMGTPGTWNHITDQIGMFSFTGLTESQVMKLREDHIYLTKNGRISMAGLNTKNIEYFSKCVDKAVRES
ncbi:hypothetical protein L228DRAFT_244383 [Xylona heveae TC161]|uniref:aspartate transaminase n=1 Tax=Xylona heveae (strain CBS 132557 / TC161) TaxID=1328760 RepID=A0A165IY01_XYLHT|nr:hypothetical protein L228DRAFT_244383 [Xylona heveae TC161]KZF25529.1 hypothetical protein L228DRAFT_244383 [Xylona heveae TC161]